MPVSKRPRCFVVALTVIGGAVLAVGSVPATASAAPPAGDRCAADDVTWVIGVLPDSAAGVVPARVPPGCGRQNLAGVLPETGGLATGFPLVARA